MTTHTYALLEISAGAYDEIAAKLRAAGYDHAFNADGEIDMHGIGLEKVEKSEEMGALSVYIAAYIADALQRFVGESNTQEVRAAIASVIDSLAVPPTIGHGG